MSPGRRAVRIALALATACSFACFIWPTPWEYFEAGTKLAYRRNRISGELQFHPLTPGSYVGWTNVRVPRPPLPQEEVPLRDRMRQSPWTPGTKLPDGIRPLTEEDAFPYLVELGAWPDESLKQFAGLSTEYVAAVFGAHFAEELEQVRSKHGGEHSDRGGK